MHVVAQDARLHCRGDFGGAGGLGTVADNAAGGGDGVGNGVGNTVQVRAQQVGNARSRPGSGTDRAAEGGETSDAGFLVDGGQVGQAQSPVELLVADLQLLGVLDDGQGSGHALVAAAGVDDHGHFTAVHPGVGTGRCHGLGPDHDAALTVGLKQHTSDVGAVVPPKTFLGDGAVVLDLPIQNVLHVGDVHGFREVQDVPQIQAGAVGKTGLALALHRRIQEHLAVALDVDDIRVIVDDPDAGTVLPVENSDHDLKGQTVVDVLHGNGGALQIGAHLGDLLRGHVRDDLQLPGCVAAHDSGYRRRGNALHVVGIGNNHAFHVLDDAAAGTDGHPIGHLAQNLPGLRRAVGQGDGLGAAHGRHQLLLQNADIGAVIGIFFVHVCVSSFLPIITAEMSFLRGQLCVVEIIQKYNPLNTTSL